MPRFKKKPVEIEAMQWKKGMARAPIIEFANYLVRMDDVEDEFYVYDRLHDTWVEFEYNDWIIKGVQGEFYPCKPDVFNETYDPVVALRDNTMTLESREVPNVTNPSKSRGKW